MFHIEPPTSSGPPAPDEARPEFLSIKDVADYLALEYKTIYRLVKRGEIPAAKIGGSYRIRRSDLEAYIDDNTRGRSREPDPREAQAAAICSCCSRALFSILSVRGTCEVCGEAICDQCWELEGRRTCPRHLADVLDKEESPVEAGAEPPPALAADALDGPLTCGGCGRGLPFGAVTASCAKTDCDQPLCDHCAKAQSEARCRAHGRTPEEILAAAREALGRGEIATIVTTSQALFRSDNVVNRFESRVGSLKTLPSVGTRPGPPVKVTRLKRESGHGMPGRSAVGGARVPGEARVNAVLRRAGRGSESGPRKVALTLHVFARSEPYESRGFDTTPADEGDLLRILDQHRAELGSGSGSGLLVLGIASITGWSDQAAALVRGIGAGSALFDRSIALILLDPAGKGPVCSSLDDRLTPYVPLFTGETEAESLRSIGDFALGLLGRQQSVSEREVAEGLGINRELSRRALEMLAGAKGLSSEHLADFGLVLTEKRRR
jgi:excisionase family DNA binding protein